MSLEEGCQLKMDSNGKGPIKVYSCQQKTGVKELQPSRDWTKSKTKYFTCKNSTKNVWSMIFYILCNSKLALKFILLLAQKYEKSSEILNLIFYPHNSFEIILRDFYNLITAKSQILSSSSQISSSFSNFFFLFSLSWINFSEPFSTVWLIFDSISM